MTFKIHRSVEDIETLVGTGIGIGDERAFKIHRSVEDIETSRFAKVGA